jgi:hypothetical protein
MVKKMLFSTGLVLVALLLLTACSPGSSLEVKASLGQEFTLPVGQTAVINGQNLSIKFEEVTADSRCAIGVECIRAGDAKCQMQITSQGSTSTVILTDTGGTDGYTHDVFNQYKVSFRLEPFPRSGEEIAPGDYRLIMKVS